MLTFCGLFLDKYYESNFWVSGNRTGTWSINIQKSFNYNMSGVKLRTLNNSNHTPITCRVFTDIPKAITKKLNRIEINTPQIVISGVIKDDVNFGGNKIENLGAPTQNNEAVTKGYVDKLVHNSAIQPSHYKDEFSYIMERGSEWTDEIGQGTSFNIKKIANLAPNKGNFHTYNYKVIYLKINKNSLGGYKVRMGINFFRLLNGHDYTLCLEVLDTHRLLWDKTTISIQGTSSGLNIGNIGINKLSYNYKDSASRTQIMYYHKVIIPFTKLNTGSRFFLHIGIDIPQTGSDLSLFPRKFEGMYIVAYGVKGRLNNIDSDKVYDYHTAYDIKPTEVTMNVDINMNSKKLKNIALDKNVGNSAATVAMVKELIPFTKNYFYKSYFSEIYDFTNANNYKLSRGSSGVVFNNLKSLSGNTLSDMGIPNRTIDDIKEEGLNINNYSISFSPPFGISKYTLCIVFYH